MDYEALGRYVAHKEKAKVSAITRSNAFKDLIRMVQVAIEAETSSMVAMDFDFSKARELLHKAAESHGEMLLAVAEANMAADASGNQKLIVGR